VEVSRFRPMVGRATVSPLKSMVMRRVVKAIAITTHHLRSRSVIRCISSASQYFGYSRYCFRSVRLTDVALAGYRPSS
jgi:hypothetical protein